MTFSWFYHDFSRTLLFHILFISLTYLSLKHDKNMILSWFFQKPFKYISNSFLFHYYSEPMINHDIKMIYMILLQNIHHITRSLSLRKFSPITHILTIFYPFLSTIFPKLRLIPENDWKSTLIESKLKTARL